jgi:excisionase family DNA binding protein
MASTGLGFRDVDWVADQLGLDKNTVYRYLNDGRLPGLQIGKKWLIDEETMRAWLLREQQRQTERRQAASLMQSELGAHVGENGTVTMLFGDIKGASAMLERLGDAAFHQVVRALGRMAVDLLPEEGRSQPKMLGDGFMVAFGSARAALDYAAALQRAVAAYNADHPEAPIPLTLSLHAGEVTTDDGDFHGKTVFIAARLVNAAQPGEVLASSVVRDLVASGDSSRFENEREVDLGPLGRHRAATLIWQ